MKPSEPLKKISFLTIASVFIVGSLWFNHFLPGASTYEKDLHSKAENELVNQQETLDAENDQDDPSEEDIYSEEWWEWELSEPETHINILLLGLDDHGMSDAIMIFSYHLETYETSVVAIKRDTYVAVQTWAEGEPGTSQLTYAHMYGMGPDKNYDHGARYALIWIEYLLDIPLHGYASITFDGFTALIDQIGGGRLRVHPAFAERDQDPLPTGTQTLDGQKALAYARHRSNPRIAEPDSDSQDGDRIRRNQRLLQAIFKELKELSEDELFAIYEKVQDNIHTNLDDWDLMAMANIYYHTDIADMNLVVLPGEPVEMLEEGSTEPTFYYLLDQNNTDQILNDLGLKQ